MGEQERYAEYRYRCFLTAAGGLDGLQIAALSSLPFKRSSQANPLPYKIVFSVPLSFMEEARISISVGISRVEKEDRVILCSGVWNCSISLSSAL